MRTMFAVSVMAWLIFAGAARCQQFRPALPSPPGPLAPAQAEPEMLPIPQSSIASDVDEAQRHDLTDLMPGYQTTESPGAAPDAFEGTARFSSKIWLKGEYLHWWIDSDNTPPLLTLGDAGDAIPGALGQPGTLLVFGDAEDESSAGFRFTLGLALDWAGTSSVEATVLFLHQDTVRIQAPPGDRVVARPFISADTGAQDAFVVFSPGVVTGAVTATTSTELFGFEGNYRYRWEHEPGMFLSILAGFRYVRLSDEIRVDERSTSVISTPLLRADELIRFDDISSQNHFSGPQLGIEAECYLHYLILTAYGKIAAGWNHNDVMLRGGTSARNIVGGAFAPSQVGFLVQQTNRGQFRRDGLGVLGEFGLHCGFDLSENVRIGVGYSSIYWSRVARAGNQIDVTVNTSQTATTGAPGALVGPVRPLFTGRDSRFSVHGLAFTLELRF